MNNNTQLYQSSEKKSFFKSAIKAILLVILGIILGAGVVSIFYFLRSEYKGGISQKTQVEIFTNFKEELVKNYPILFKESSLIDTYMMETEEGAIGVSTTISPSDEQFKIILGIDPKELNPEESEQLKGVVIIAQAEYVREKGEYVLKGEPKIYQGTELSLLQESLGTARDKARDAGIKSELSSMRAAAEWWWQDHDGSYEGFCASADAQRSITYIAGNGKIALCGGSTTTWAAFSSLYDATAQCFCVDSQWTAKALNAPCPKAAVTVCP